MLAEDIFIMTMAMIDEMNDNGTLDPNAVAEYRTKAPAILTMLVNEIIGIENRYRKREDYVYPVPVKTLEQIVQIDSIKANMLLTNGLAAHLMIHENKKLANFFQTRYEEMKTSYLKPMPAAITRKTDVYDAKLDY